MSFASLNLLRSPSFLVTFLCFALKASLQQVSFAFLQLIPHSLIWKSGIVVPCAADTTDAMPALPCAPECVWSNSHATWPCNSAATLCDLEIVLHWILVLYWRLSLAGPTRFLSQNPHSQRTQRTGDPYSLFQQFLY